MKHSNGSFVSLRDVNKCREGGGIRWGQITKLACNKIERKFCLTIRACLARPIGKRIALLHIQHSIHMLFCYFPMKCRATTTKSRACVGIAMNVFGKLQVKRRALTEKNRVKERKRGERLLWCLSSSIHEIDRPMPKTLTKLEIWTDSQMMP